MKRIILVFLGLFSLAYGQTSKTGAKTFFVNGLWMGTKLDGYFNAADSNAIYWRADSVVMAKYRGTARALSFIDDTAFLTNRFVRLQTGNLYRQTGKMWISDTIRTSGLVYAESAIKSDGTITASGNGFVADGTGLDGGVLNLKQSSSQSFQGLGYSSIFAQGTDTVGFRLATTGISNRGFRFTASNIPSGTTRYFAFPNASGTIALTSNVTDSAAALRASINTKLNISDTAAMMNNNVVRTFGAQTIDGAKTFIQPLLGAQEIRSNATTGFGFYAPNITNGDGVFVSATSGRGVVGVATTGTGVRGEASGASSIGGIFTNSNATGIGLVAINSSSGAIAEFRNLGGTVASVSNAGNLTAASFIRTGGTSSQFLKADGSVDANTYATTSSLGSYVPYTGATTNVNLGSNTLTAGGATLTGALSGTSGTFGGVLQVRKDATTGGDEQLLVQGATNTNKVLRLGYETTGNYGSIQAAITGTSFSPLILNGGGGNVGIGTTSPNIGGVNRALTLNSDAATNASYELAVNGVLQGSLYTSIGINAIILGNFASGPTLFVNGGSERTRITSAGRWLFNTTTDDGSSVGQFNGNVALFGGSLLVPNTYGVNFRNAANSAYRSGITLNGSNNIVIGADTDINSVIIGTSAATSALTIANAGAATFSSSVSAATYINTTTSVTGAYSVASGVGTVFADATSGSFTVTLPTASSWTGRMIYVKRTDCTLANSVTVSGATGSGSLGARDGALYISNGSTWYAIATYDGNGECS